MQSNSTCSETPITSWDKRPGNAYGKEWSWELNHTSSRFMGPEEMDINVQVHRTLAALSCPGSAALQRTSALEATLFPCQNRMECTERSALGIYVFCSYLEITGKRTWLLLPLHRCSELRALGGSGFFNQNSTWSEAMALYM